MDGASQKALVDEITRASHELNRSPARPYLDRIRRVTARLAAMEAPHDDARAALLVVQDHTTIDVEVPTASRFRGGTLLKTAVKRLIRFYLTYVTRQVGLLGHAMVRFGEALVERTERLEQSTAAVEDRVDALERRVQGLERTLGDR
jgi:hypothetical protein